MGIWQRLVGKSGNTDQKNPASWLVDWVTGGQHTVSGESVTPETAMRLTAVYACVNVRSQDVAKLPLILYRRTKDGGKERAAAPLGFSSIARLNWRSAVAKSQS